jgi:hypothetical protein
MKRIALLLILLAIPLAASAQTITLGPIAKTAYCVGDTMFVPYTATGTFNPGNYFFAELSDASGSFAGFTPFGHSTPAGGSLAVPLLSIGEHFRVRVASEDPYATSTNNGGDLAVYGIPNPMPFVSRNHSVNQWPEYPFLDTLSFAIGLVSDSFHFADQSNEVPATGYSWKFDQDASPSMSSSIKPAVTYGHSGIKNGSLTELSPGGYSRARFFQFRIIDCNPVLPQNIHAVTGTETGNYPSVWVKPGGSYIPPKVGSHDVFVEAGGSVTISGGAILDVFYLKQGASIKMALDGGNALLVLSNGITVSYDQILGGVDTAYCPDLTFDYSQVSGGVAEEAQPQAAAPRISQSGDRLFVSAEDAAVNVRVVNVLGNEIASADGRGTVDIDLTPLPAGIYFAIAQSGRERAIKRIVAVH